MEATPMGVELPIPLYKKYADNVAAVCWRGTVSPPVRGVVDDHSVHLPAAQEICPHPLAKNAKVLKCVLSRLYIFYTNSCDTDMQ